MKPHPESLSAPIEHYNNPKVRSDIPDLQEALEQWYATGITSLAADIPLMITRANLMPRAHIPFEVACVAYAHHREYGSPLATLRHEAVVSAADKQLIFDEQAEQIKTQLNTPGPVLPIKTVTISVERDGSPLHFLFPVIGDRYITKQDKRDIAEELGISNSAGKKAKINIAEVDPRTSIGQTPGIIGPFISRSLLLPNLFLSPNDITGVLYFSDDNPPDTLVGIATSPIDSIIVDKATFEALLLWWDQETQDFSKNPDLPRWHPPTTPAALDVIWTQVSPLMDI